MRSFTTWLATLAIAATPSLVTAAVITGDYSFGASRFGSLGGSVTQPATLFGRLSVELRDDAQSLAGFPPGSSFALPLNPLDALLAFDVGFSGLGLVRAAHFELNEVEDLVIADAGTFARNPPSLAATPGRFNLIARDSDTGVKLVFFWSPDGDPLVSLSDGPIGTFAADPFVVLGDAPPPDDEHRVPLPGSLALALAALAAAPWTGRHRWPAQRAKAGGSPACGHGGCRPMA